MSKTMEEHMCILLSLKKIKKNQLHFNQQTKKRTRRNDKKKFAVHKKAKTSRKHTVEFICMSASDPIYTKKKEILKRYMHTTMHVQSKEEHKEKVGKNMVKCNKVNKNKKKEKQTKQFWGASLNLHDAQCKHFTNNKSSRYCNTQLLFSCLETKQKFFEKMFNEKNVEHRTEMKCLRSKHWQLVLA